MRLSVLITVCWLYHLPVSNGRHALSCLQLVNTLVIICMVQDDPEAIKGKLGDFLKENGVAYEFSTNTKFGRFRKRQASKLQ